MAQEKEFLERIATDPAAKELMKGLKKTSGDEEAAEECVKVAEKLGYNISKEKILELIKINEKLQQEKAATAETAVKKALSEEELDAVAGGDSICYDTYMPDENCLLIDECNMVFRSYDELPAISTLDDGAIECNQSHINLYQDDGWVNWIEDWHELSDHVNNLG